MKVIFKLIIIQKFMIEMITFKKNENRMLFSFYFI